jgi:hypothetical protein
VQDPARLTIACDLCHRPVGRLTVEAVISMLPAISDLRGKRPPTRHALTHPMRPESRRSAKRCRFRKMVTQAWVDRAWKLAEQTGRTRLYAAEVDLARFD